MEFEFEVWLRGLPSETVLHVTPSETAPRGAANVVSAGELLGWAAVYPGAVDSSGEPPAEQHDRSLTAAELGAMTDAELLEAVVGHVGRFVGDWAISSPALGELRGRLVAADLTPGPEPVPWQQQVIDQHQLEQELASRIGVRDDETATHAIARWALSKLTPDTRRRVASEAFDVEPRFGPGGDGGEVTIDSSSFPADRFDAGGFEPLPRIPELPMLGPVDAVFRRAFPHLAAFDAELRSIGVIGDDDPAVVVLRPQAGRRSAAAWFFDVPSGSTLFVNPTPRFEDQRLDLLPTLGDTRLRAIDLSIEGHATASRGSGVPLSVEGILEDPTPLWTAITVPDQVSVGVDPGGDGGFTVVNGAGEVVGHVAGGPDDGAPQGMTEQAAAEPFVDTADRALRRALFDNSVLGITIPTAAMVADELLAHLDRGGWAITAKAVTPDESAKRDEQDEGAVYGLEVEAPSASYQARSVIGRLETSLAGNLILRVGRQNEPGLAGPWHQTEHVVLAPDEALRFAVAVVAKVAKQEPVTIDLAGQRAARLFDKLDKLHASMATAGVEPEFPWTIGEDLPYATLVETTLGELGELLDVIRPRGIKPTLGGSIEGTGYWALDDVPLPDGVPHALAVGAPRIALRDPNGRSWAGWMALDDLDSLRVQLDLGRDWLEGKRPVPDGGELTHAQQTTALSSAIRGDVGDLAPGWDDDEVHDVVACLIDNGYRIIGSGSPVPPNLTPVRRLISRWRLRASDFEAAFDPDDEVNEAVVDELRTCANELWDALDRPDLDPEPSAADAPKPLIEVLADFPVPPAPPSDAPDGVPVKAVLAVAWQLDADAAKCDQLIEGEGEAHGGVLHAQWRGEANALRAAAAKLRDIIPVPPGALGRLAEAIGVPEAQLEQLAESIGNRPDDDPDDVSIMGAVHTLRDWAADGLSAELYEPVVKVLPGLMVKLVELGWRDCSDDVYPGDIVTTFGGPTGVSSQMVPHNQHFDPGTVEGTAVELVHHRLHRMTSTRCPKAMTHGETPFAFGDHASCDSLTEAQAIVAEVVSVPVPDPTGARLATVELLAELLEDRYPSNPGDRRHMVTAERLLGIFEAVPDRQPDTEKVAMKHYAKKLLGRELRRNPGAYRDTALVELNTLLGEPFTIDPDADDPDVPQERFTFVEFMLWLRQRNDDDLLTVVSTCSPAPKVIVPAGRLRGWLDNRTRAGYPDATDAQRVVWGAADEYGVAGVLKVLSEHPEVGPSAQGVIELAKLSFRMMVQHLAEKITRSTDELIVATGGAAVPPSGYPLPTVVRDLSEPLDPDCELMDDDLDPVLAGYAMEVRRLRRLIESLRLTVTEREVRFNDRGKPRRSRDHALIADALGDILRGDHG